MSAMTSDFEACRRLIKTGSRSFYAASLLLPWRVRKPAYALYAFCRVSDDAVDDPNAGMASLEQLHARLEAVYRSAPNNDPVDRAFAHMVEMFEMPRALPEALLDGFLWDLEGRRYQTLDDLHAYAARVAGSVGAMMTVLMRRRSRGTLARACDLGVAMQMTNMARDVGEDARNGRIYLPLDWLEDLAINPDQWISDPQHSPRVAGMVRNMLRDADTLYDRAVGGVLDLPFDCRPAIHAARLIYREIGREIEDLDCNSVDYRAIVSKRRKKALLGTAVVASTVTTGRTDHPPLAETAYLVEAATQDTRQSEHERTEFLPWTHIDDRAGRLIELLGVLDERQQTAARQGVIEYRY